ncbi:MAG: hypothetical protein ACQESJ_06655 [Bacteroidota bacterium]
MKRFYSTIVITLFFSLISCSIYAQQEGMNVREQIEKEKIAFFTEKIGLTIEEAKEFWPIYNEYWDKKNQLIQDRKESMNYYLKHSDSMSRKELDDIADRYVNYRYEKGQLLKEYHQKFKEILPIEKVMRIYMADYDFKSYLLNKLKEHKEKNDD